MPDTKSFLLILALAAAVTGLPSPAAFAHHSYSAFDRERLVTIRGVLEEAEWRNPHIVLQIRTDAGELYRIEWNTVMGLKRTGVPENPFQAGDRVIATGAPHRDPSVHILTPMSEVRRPSDGWAWKKPAINTMRPVRTASAPD